MKHGPNTEEKARNCRSAFPLCSIRGLNLFSVSSCIDFENPSCTSVKVNHSFNGHTQNLGKPSAPRAFRKLAARFSERRQALLDLSEYKQTARSPSNRRWRVLQSCCDFGECFSFTFRAR